MIIGNPVHAFDEHRSAVDRDGEGGADVIGRGVQFDAAKSQPALPAIEFMIAGGQYESQLSQRLLAVANGPPYRRIRDVNDECRRGTAMINCALDTLAENVSGQDERRFRIKTFQFNPQLHPTGPTIVESHERHYLSYPRNAPTLQPHRLPETSRAQVRPPVPAKAAGHLANEVERRRVWPGAVSKSLAFGFGVRGGRMKINLQFERSATDVGGNVEAVRAVHVVGASQLDLLQPHGPDSVDAVKDKIDTLVRPGSSEVEDIGVQHRRVAPVDRHTSR